MEILYHLTLNNLDVILSNLPKEMIKDIVDLPLGFKVENNGGYKKRIEKVSLDNGWIYLSICDNDITNKYFKKYLEFLKTMYMPLLNHRREMSCKYEDNVRRFRHNINGYTTKIQDELENLFPSDINKRNDWKTVLSQLNNEISQKNDVATKALLHIYKNVQLIKAEMEVYDIMNTETANLNIIEHPIRKVIDLSVQSFFLDLLDKNINIKNGMSTDKVLIDFPTFSVVLGHILDNTVKYAAENSLLDISFDSFKDKLKICFSMTSILVKQDEIDMIFDEKYSGQWVSELGLQGHGIGMYYAKKLIELNNGKIEFIAGKEKYKLDGVPYADNVIEITLNKAKN